MTPDIVGDLPRASWKYWLKKTVPANIAIPTNSEASEARVMVRLRNSRSGMIGSLGLGLDEHEEQRRARPRRRPSRTVCQDIQSYLSPAKVTQTSSSETAALMKNAPRPVDLDLALDDRELQGLLEHDQRDDRERHADVEAPAPAEPARCR